MRPAQHTAKPAAALALIAMLIGTIGCTSDGGISFDSVYEGVFGDEVPPTPTQAVAMMFNRSDADQRRKGVGWLSAAPFGGEEEYLASYRLLADDPDPSVRAAAARAIGMHGTAEDAMLLTILLEDDDALVRWQAADGLRKLHNTKAVGSLLARLNADVEDDADTRAAAAQALGQYADAIVFARLAATLEDRSFTVVNAAHQSLVTLTGHDAGLDPRDWSDWAARNTDPFANQQAYTYAPYAPTRDWFDAYVTFWNNKNQEPQTPTGLSQADGE